MALGRKYDFKLYEILKVLNGYFTPESEDFFDYCVNTLDKHSSFLRSRFCKRDVPLEDYGISPDINCVLCAFNIPADLSLVNANDILKMKMQIVFCKENKLESEKELCKNLGFSYGYLLNPHTNKITNLGYMK